MDEILFNKWVLEVTNQEYKGNINKFYSYLRLYEWIADKEMLRV